MNAPTPGDRARASACLDDETLGAFLEGRLEPSWLARIDEHAASCARCRELVALGSRVAGESLGRPPRVGASALFPPGGFGNGRVGTTLKEKWHLDASIGTGGMAEVYAGTHRNGKRVAIKVLLPQLAVDPELCRRFVQEGYIANQVDHPGVVSVHDDDVTDDGAPFLVMDLLEGESIADVIERGRMPVAASVRVALELLDIVAAAHAKGIVHRDVKPGNVFLTTSGSVRLLDFGIARATDNANAIATMTGATMGTPAYMPPEQARGLMRDVDARSDLWAVGATLFSMITAAKVREGETNNELLVMAVTEPVRSIVHRAPWIAPALAAVVDKSLSFDKADRFQSAAEMKAALASLPPEMLRDPALQMPAHVPSTTHVPATVAAPPPAFTMMSASRSSPANEIPLATRGPGSRSRARTPMLVGGGTLAFVALVVLAIVFGPLARRAAPAAATAPPEPAASSVFAPSEPLTTIPLEVPPPAPPLSSVATDVVAPPASSLAPQKKAKSVGTAQSSATPAPAKSDAPPDPYGRRL